MDSPSSIEFAAKNGLNCLMWLPTIASLKSRFEIYANAKSEVEQRDVPMGDMLFLSEGGRVTRVHGAFVSDSEVERIVSHIRKQENPDYIDEIVEEKEDRKSVV